MTEYDGRRGYGPARSDNDLVDGGWCRIWPQVSELFFDGGEWKPEEFGSYRDAERGVDGSVSGCATYPSLPTLIVARRIQRRPEEPRGRYPYNSFTPRENEIRKYKSQTIDSGYQVQAYLDGDWNSQLLMAACVHTKQLWWY